MTEEKTLRQRIRDGEVLVALRGSVHTTKSQLADIWATGRYDRSLSISGSMVSIQPLAKSHL